MMTLGEAGKYRRMGSLAKRWRNSGKRLPSRRRAKGAAIKKERRLVTANWLPTDPSLWVG